MADFRDILASAGYRNWMKCSIAQKIVHSALSEVVDSEIDAFQKDVLQSIQYSKGLASSTTCNQCQTPNLLPCPTPKLCHLHRNKCSFHNGPSLQQRQCPTHGLCDYMCNEIIDTHLFRGPSWKNTDSTKWCTMAWTIAKCFMPTDGYTDVTSVAKTDFNGLINVIINCVRFQRHFQDDLSQRSNTFTKVRENCRGLKHSPTMNMTDGEMNDFIDSLVSILNDPVFMQIPKKYMHTCTSRELIKLKTDTLHISAADMNCSLDDAKQSMRAVLETLKKEPIANLDTHKLSHILETIKEKQTITDEVRSLKQKHASEEHISYEIPVYDRNIDYNGARELKRTEIIKEALYSDDESEEEKIHVYDRNRDYNGALKKEPIADLDTQRLSHSLETIKEIQTIIDEVRSLKQKHASEEPISYLLPVYDRNRAYNRARELIRTEIIKEELYAIESEVDELLQQSLNKEDKYEMTGIPRDPKECILF